MTPTPPPQMTPSFAKASEATPEEEARAIVAPFRIDAAIVYPPDYEPLGGDAKELVAAIAAALRARAAPPASAEVQGVVERLREWASNPLCVYAAALLLRLDARVRELEALVYVPGLWRCAKCECQLVSTNMHAYTGAMSADNSPQVCPNNCGPMWRVTEREAGNRLIDQQDKLAERATAAEARLRLAEEVVEQGRGYIDWLESMPTGTAETFGEKFNVDQAKIWRADYEKALSAYTSTGEKGDER